MIILTSLCWICNTSFCIYCASHPLTSIVNVWVIKSFKTFDSMDRTLQWCCLFFSLVCNFVKCISFGLGTVRSERVNRAVLNTLETK